VVSEILKQYRSEHGISQRELAKQIGVTQAAVSLWERGERSPSIPLMRDIGALTGAPAEELLEPERRPP